MDVMHGGKSWDTATGFLFIGDPHLSSIRPGSRKKEDWIAVCLDKVKQAIDIANDRNAIPIFLGDMFHKGTENNNKLKNGLLEILASANHKPIVNVGNHDLKETELTDDLAIVMLKASRVAYVIDQITAFEINNFCLVIIPYGKEIPKELPRYNKTVLVTHDDFYFDGGYPGSIKPFEISGVAAVVNGHVHGFQKPTKIGDTIWYNPGTILRRNIDEQEHKPAVMFMDFAGNVTMIPLAVKHDVFNQDVPHVLEPEKQIARTKFVKALQAVVQYDRERTEDGSAIMQTLDELLNQKKVDPVVDNFVRLLCQAAIEPEKRGLLGL